MTTGLSIYEQGREAHPEMPTWDEIREQGVYKVKLDPVIGLKDFRDDPEGHRCWPRRRARLRFTRGTCQPE